MPKQCKRISIVHNETKGVGCKRAKKEPPIKKGKEEKVSPVKVKVELEEKQPPVKVKAELEDLPVKAKMEPLVPFSFPAELLGRCLYAPHKFFYLINRSSPPCWSSVPRLYGKVVALPTEENNQYIEIEWLGMEHDGPYEDILEALRPHLCPLFGSLKYGSYIQDLILDWEECSKSSRNPFHLCPASPSSSGSNSDSDLDDNVSRRHC